MNAQQVVDPSQVAEPLVVDRMRWWDLEEVLTLERALFPDAPWTAGQLWSELARVPESRWYVLARRAGRIVGYAGVFVVGHEASHHILGHINRKGSAANMGAVILGGLASAYGGNAEAIKSAQDFGAQFGARYYSKDWELEAD